MLRELQVTKDKPANAMFKASDACVTGMAVVKNHTNGTFEFPSSATAKDIYFVDKERIALGYKAAVATQLSDYDEDYVNVAAGEFAKVVAYYPGERIANDQVDTTGLSIGDSLEAGTNGKLAKASSETKYKYVGEYIDGSHTLALIEIIG